MVHLKSIKKNFPQNISVVFKICRSAKSRQKNLCKKFQAAIPNANSQKLILLNATKIEICNKTLQADLLFEVLGILGFFIKHDILKSFLTLTQ